MNYKKIILTLFSIAFLGYFFGLNRPIQIKAAEFTSDSYSREDTYFRIQNFDSFVSGGQQIKAALRIQFLEEDMTTIRLPASPDLFHIAINQDNALAWYEIETLYSFIREHSKTPEDQAIAVNILEIILAAEEEFYGLSTPPVRPPAAVAENTIKIDPPAIVQGASTIITGTYGNQLGDKESKRCYIYIGANDGTGRYWLKNGPSGSSVDACTFTWETTTSTPATTVGHHGVFIVFEEDFWTAPESTTVLPTDSDTNIVHNVINVCASGTNVSECRDVSNTGGSGGWLTVNGYNSANVTLGSSSSPVFRFYISDPAKANEYSGAGKKCYFYIGDGTGTDQWTLKDATAITGGSANNLKQPNCIYDDWDFSGTLPGYYRFMVNILDAGLDNPAGVSNNSPNIVSVTVCATGTTDCRNSGGDATGITGGGSGGSGGSGGGGGGGSTSAFSGFVSGNEFMTRLQNVFKSIDTAFPRYVATNIIGLLALIAMLVGGMMILSSGGDPAKEAKGKKTIIYGLIALVIASLSYGIITYAIHLF